MRTTVDIPDALGRRVKVRTAQTGQPLKAFFARALERELAAESLAVVHPHRRHLPVIKSRTPGSLKLTPDEISALLVQEELASHAATAAALHAYLNHAVSMLFGNASAAPTATPQKSSPMPISRRSPSPDR